MIFLFEELFRHFWALCGRADSYRSHLSIYLQHYWACLEIYRGYPWSLSFVLIESLLREQRRHVFQVLYGGRYSWYLSILAEFLFCQVGPLYNFCHIFFYRKVYSLSCLCRNFTNILCYYYSFCYLACFDSCTSSSDSCTSSNSSNSTYSCPTC